MQADTHQHTHTQHLTFTHIGLSVFTQNQSDDDSGHWKIPACSNRGYIGTNLKLAQSICCLSIWLSMNNFKVAMKVVVEKLIGKMETSPSRMTTWGGKETLATNIVPWWD